MKTQGTYQSFINEIIRREDEKVDYLTHTRNIRMYEDKGININGMGYYGITDYAHGQIANKLGIPKKYYDKIRCISGLRSYNVNSWMTMKNEEQFVRILDGNIRAFLSNRFRPIDNAFIFKAFEPTLLEHPEARIKATCLTEKRMYIQVIFPSIQQVIDVGDIVQAGVTLSNSEVGAGAVDIKSMVWRLKCKNGMIGSSVMRKYHVGRRMGSEEGDYDVFQDDTIKAELKAYQKKLRDLFHKAISESILAEQVDQMRLAKEDRIEKPMTFTQNITKHMDFSFKDSEAVLSNMTEEGQLNRYGFANGTSYLAHKTENRDMQYDYEKKAHVILHMKKNEWEKIIA